MTSRLRFEVVLLQPIVTSGHRGAGGVDDGTAGSLESSLGAIVNIVDAAANSLGSTEGLTAEPFEISHNGLRAGLCCGRTLLHNRFFLLFSVEFGEFILPLRSKSLSESLSLVLSVETVGNLSVEVVAVVVSLLLSVGSGGSGGESSVECAAHCVIDQISLLL